jgi:uncharacterized protein YkwD
MSSYQSHPQYAFELITLINQYRAQNGAQPLLIDHTLMDLAQGYTDYLKETGRISHTADGLYPWTRIENSGFVYEQGLTGSKIGNENLHYGYSSKDGYDDPQEALEGWITSGGHNRNMLNPEWDRVGIGYRDGLYTAEFGDGPDQPVGGSLPTTPIHEPDPAPAAGSFGPTQAVMFSVPDTGRLADYAKVKIGSLVDQNQSTGTIRVYALKDGKVIASGSANLPEPGGTLKVDASTGFDAVRVKAGESDVTGVVLDVDWFLLGDPGPSTPQPTIGAFEQRVIELTNGERVERGLAPLKSNGELNEAADRHAEDMAANRYFSHVGLDGDRAWDRAEEVGYSSSGFGENIARGQPSPEAVVTAWMNSSGHRANILNTNYRDIGVGYESGYWVQNFGTGDTNSDSFLV